LTLISRCLFALLIAILPVQLAAAPVRKPVPHAASVARAPGKDWSTVATRLPSGAFLWGNPDAKVRLVEYLSLTCPHCAHLEGEAIPPLTAKYIRPGLVNYEVRHALRDGFDYAGSILARCDGPETFFSTLPKVFAQQNVWFARAQSWSRIEQAEGQQPDQMLPKLARGAGFDGVFGMTNDRIDACLGNHAEQDLLNAQANEAWRRPGFPGTPTFLINDQMQASIGTWADLDAALAAALHSNSSPRKTAR
jgi:protein-disulfide isomerase